MKRITIQLFIDDVDLLNQDIVIQLNNKSQEINLCKDCQEADTDFFVFMKEIIYKLKQQGSIRTSETYTSTMNSLRQFYEKDTLPMNTIDSDFAMAYERHLKQRGVCMNTISFYMRILRAVYNRAVRQELIIDRRPFLHVYTAVGKTEKRAIDLRVLCEMTQLQCRRKSEALARDLFIFSFITRGMSFIDMAFLKKNDVKDGILSYRRSKTGQLIRIKWEPQMQAIVDKFHSTENTPYLLPIIKHPNKDARNQYRYMLCDVNRKLKIIGQKLHAERNLSMYVARHTWATIAKSLGTSLEVISQAMGHTSEKMTHIYLKSINNNQIDKVNRQILQLIENTQET